MTTYNNMPKWSDREAGLSLLYSKELESTKDKTFNFESQLQAIHRIINILKVAKSEDTNEIKKALKV